MDGIQEHALLSVIVPVYQVAPYLEECVHSLLTQTYAPIEVLLVDDGSKDGGGVLCDELVQRDARIRAFHQENAGQSSAKNVGIRHARGAYIAFVDGDDSVEPEMYATMIGAMQETGANVAACAFHYIFPNGSVYTGCDSGEIRTYSREDAILAMAKGEPLHIESALKVYTREALGDARFPEGQLYEEVGFARMVARTMGRLVYVDRPYYRYRQQREGNTNSSFPVRKLLVLGECDAFVRELHAEGLERAADAMAAFTLEHIMRMFGNAKACRADRTILKRLRNEYRARYQSEKANPYVRKLRGMLFAASPDVYDRLSRWLHSRRA